MKASLVRYLAVVAMSAVALVSAQGSAPAAAEPTASVTKADGCVDGVKEAQVHLRAADAAATTFTTIVGDDFKDASRVVPAGTTYDLSIPNLTYGSYWIRVYADGDFI